MKLRGCTWFVLLGVSIGCGTDSQARQNLDAAPPDGRDANSDDEPSTGDGGAADPGGGKADAAGPDASEPDPSVPDYGDLEIKPDSDTTKVASCTGKPNLTLCNIVTTPDRWYDVCIDEQCVSPGCGQQSCNTDGPHFEVPPMYGHHALRKQGENEPVTVDLITGLHWQACVGGLSGAACTQGTALTPTWAEALAYCDQLTWAGHDDWYLPDAYEAGSIIDFSIVSKDGYLDQDVFPNLAASGGFYWTNTFGGSSPVLLDTGGPSSGSNGRSVFTNWEGSSKRSARCVRRGFSLPAPTLDTHRLTKVDTLQPVVNDATTKLSWQGCSTTTMAKSCSDFQKFLPDAFETHCEALVWAGESDWRAPSYKEIHSLFDYLGRRFQDDKLSTGGDDLMTFGGGIIDVRDGERVSTAYSYRGLCVRGPHE